MHVQESKPWWLQFEISEFVLATCFAAWTANGWRIAGFELMYFTLAFGCIVWFGRYVCRRAKQRNIATIATCILIGAAFPLVQFAWLRATQGRMYDPYVPVWLQYTIAAILCGIGGGIVGVMIAGIQPWLTAMSPKRDWYTYFTIAFCSFILGSLQLLWLRNE